MTRWYDKACEELELSLDREEISNEEFKAEMWELNEELRQSASDAAESAYNDVMGE